MDFGIGARSRSSPPRRRARPRLGRGALGRRLSRRHLRAHAAGRGAGRPRRSRPGPVTVVPFVADMTKADDIDALLAGVRTQLGDPDIVVGNAGGPPAGTFASTKLEQFIPAVELSMMSSIRLTGAVPAMVKKSGAGSSTSLPSR